MSNLSVLSVPYFTEVIQRLTTIPAIIYAFLARSRAAGRVLASGAVLILLYKLIHGRRKPKRLYVRNLTEVGKIGDSEALADYDIIIVGGGTLSFQNKAKLRNVNAWVRNRWLCTCFSSFRESEYSRAPA